MLPSGTDSGVVSYRHQMADRTESSQNFLLAQNVSLVNATNQPSLNNSDNPTRNWSIYNNDSFQSQESGLAVLPERYGSNVCSTNSLNNGSQQASQRQQYFSENRYANAFETPSPFRLLPVSFPNVGTIPCWQGLVLGALVTNNGRTEIQPLCQQYGELGLQGYMKQPVAVDSREPRSVSFQNTGMKNPRPPVNSCEETRVVNTRKFEAGQFVYEAGKSDTVFHQQRFPMLLSGTETGDSGSMVSENRTTTVSNYDNRKNISNQNQILLMLCDNTNSYTNLNHQNSGEHIHANQTDGFSVNNNPAVNNNLLMETEIQYPYQRGQNNQDSQVVSSSLQPNSQQSQLLSNLNVLPTNFKQPYVYLTSSSLPDGERSHGFQASDIVNSQVPNFATTDENIENSNSRSSCRPHNVEQAREFQTRTDIHPPAQDVVVANQSNETSAPYLSCRPQHINTQTLQVVDNVNSQVPHFPTYSDIGKYSAYQSQSVEHANTSTSGNIVNSQITTNINQTVAKSVPYSSHLVQNVHVDPKQSLQADYCSQNVVPNIGMRAEQTSRKPFSYSSKNTVDKTQSVNSQIQNLVPGTNAEQTFRKPLSNSSHSTTHAQIFPSGSTVTGHIRNLTDADHTLRNSVVLSARQPRIIDQTQTLPARSASSQKQMSSDGLPTRQGTIKTMPYSLCRPCTADHQNVLPTYTIVNSHIQNVDSDTHVEQDLFSGAHNSENHLVPSPNKQNARPLAYQEKQKSDSTAAQHKKQSGEENCSSERRHIDSECVGHLGREGKLRTHEFSNKCQKNDNANKNSNEQSETFDGLASDSLKQRRELLQEQIAFLRTRKSTVTQRSVSILTEVKKAVASQQSNTESMGDDIYSDTETLSVQSGSDLDSITNNETQHSPSTLEMTPCQAREKPPRDNNISKKCTFASSIKVIGGDSGFENNNCMTTIKVQVKHKKSRRRKKREKKSQKKLKSSAPGIDVPGEGLITTVIDLTSEETDDEKHTQLSYTDPAILGTEKTYPVDISDRGYSSFIMDEDTIPAIESSPILETSCDMSRQIDEALLSSMYQPDNLDLADGMLASGILNDNQSLINNSWQPSEMFEPTSENSKGEIMPTCSRPSYGNYSTETTAMESYAAMPMDNTFFEPAGNKAGQTIFQQTDEKKFITELKNMSKSSTSTPSIKKKMVSVADTIMVSPHITSSGKLVSNLTISDTSSTESCVESSYTSTDTNSMGMEKSNTHLDTGHTSMTRTDIDCDKSNFGSENTSFPSRTEIMPKTDTFTITTLTPIKILDESNGTFHKLGEKSSDIIKELKTMVTPIKILDESNGSFNELVEKRSDIIKELKTMDAIKREVDCRENASERTFSTQLSDSQRNFTVTTQSPSISSTSTVCASKVSNDNKQAEAKARKRLEMRTTKGNTSGIPIKRCKKDSTGNDDGIVKLDCEADDNVQSTNSENFIPSPDSRQTVPSPSTSSLKSSPRNKACPLQGCQFRAKSRCHIRRHLFAHLKYYPYKCSLCNYKSLQMSNVKAHWKSHRAEKFKFTYNKQDDLEVRIDAMIQEAFGPSESDEDSRETNISKRHSVQERLFACKYCSKVCRKSGYLRRHVSFKHKRLFSGYDIEKSDTKSEKRQLGKKGKNKKSHDRLITSLSVEHSQMFPDSIEVPRETVKENRQKIVQTHRKLFSDEEEPLRTKNKVSRNSHTRRFETLSSNYNCDLAMIDESQPTKIKTNLQSEKLSVSKKNAQLRTPVVCPLPGCQYKAQYRSVKMHIHTHFKYHPFLCGYCSFSSSQISGMKRHIKNKHPDNQPLYAVKTDRKLEDKMADLSQKLLQQVKGKKQPDVQDQTQTMVKNDTCFEFTTCQGKNWSKYLETVYGKSEVCQGTLERPSDLNVSLFESSPLKIRDKEWQELDNNGADSLNSEQETLKNFRNYNFSPKSFKEKCSLDTTVCEDTLSEHHSKQHTVSVIPPRLAKKKFRYRCSCGMRYNWRCELSDHHLSMHPCQDLRTGYYLCQHCNFMSVYSQGVKIHHGRMHPWETIDRKDFPISKLNKQPTVRLDDFLQVSINAFQMTMAKAGVSDVNIDNLPAAQFEKFLKRCFDYEQNKKMKKNVI
ncbi:hypothetical protein ScPMuIL_005557 [Solemya velum]